MEGVHADGDRLEQFLDNYESTSVPSFKSGEIKEFYRSEGHVNLVKGENDTPTGSSLGQQRKAWLDDRSFESGFSRTYNYRLTAYELYNALLRKVSILSSKTGLAADKALNSDSVCRASQMLTDVSCKNNDNEPLTSSKLHTKGCSYIEDLKPHDIPVLVDTASFHQVEVLRDAIWKHIALRTSIRVKIQASYLLAPQKKISYSFTHATS